MEKKKYRIFLDSNVLLSGLISDRGAPRLILDVLTLDLPVLQGVTGRYNLTEIERDIAKKLPAALVIFHEYLQKLDLDLIPVPFPDELEPFRGAAADKAMPVLASAAMGQADLFITGDVKLLSRIARQSAFSIRSLGPARFLGGVLPDILAGRDTGREKGR